MGIMALEYAPKKHTDRPKDIHSDERNDSDIIDPDIISDTVIE